jgi:histidine ammonia-lyase
MTCSQAIEYRRPLNRVLYWNVLKSYRDIVPFVQEDRVLHYDIEKSIAFLNSFIIEEFVNNGLTLQIINEVIL